MFKDKMYRELRENLELYERARFDESKNPWDSIERDSILCSFLRNEKDEDIRLVIKRHRVALAEAKESGNASEYKRELEKYRKNVLEYLAQNSKVSAEFKGMNEVDDIATGILAIRKDSGRKDPYIALQEIYLDYRLGEQDEQAVLNKAREVFGANRKYRVRKGYKEVLKGSCGISEGGLQGLDIRMIVEELSSAILVAKAKAYLYDVGYPYDKGGEVEVVSFFNTGRRRDQVMDLVDLYFEKRGRMALDECDTLLDVQKSDYRSEAFKKHCLAAYDTLQENGKDDIFLPLYIDINTGAGIFIIGRYCFSEEMLATAKRKWQKNGKEDFDALLCHFCYLYWGEIRTDELVDRDAGLPVTILVDNLQGNDIDAVIQEYQAGREQNYVAFQECNCEFPNGLDKKYKLYFEPGYEDEEDKDFTLEEYVRVREQELAKRGQEAAKNIRNRG